MKINITAIILTFNEAANIRACLESIKDVISEIYIVDSGSTDNTLQIAKEYNCKIVNHPFENYSLQRNWALANLSISNNWILNLDADHRLTVELKNELKAIFDKNIPPGVNGFLTSRRTIFMGKWIRHGGHYPTYHSVLFKKGKGYCEIKKYDQHFKVEGDLVKLKGDIIDIITDSLFNFTARHNKWSDLEAAEQYSGIKNEDGVIESSRTGNAIQKRRYLKTIYEKFPLFIRPFFYFIIRYFFRMGFLDGTRGLIFHFLQGFWFRFLVDAKIYELNNTGSTNVNNSILKENKNS